MVHKLRCGVMVPLLVAATLFANTTSAGAAPTPDATARGVILGTVNVSPYIPLLGEECIATTYTFSSTTMAGVFVSTDSGLAVGAGTIGATGGSPCEVLQSAGGTIAITSISGFSGVLLCAEPEPDLPVALQGGFARVGPVVLADVVGDVNINHTDETDCEELDVTVEAQFVPNGMGRPTSATFVSNFTGVAFGDSLP